jgi:DNA-binding response OmpR family regulator
MKPPQPRVLIADDDEHLVDVLRRRCRHLGLQVETAHDGLTVLNSLDTNVPDLMILDINMPHGNGLDLCQMLVGDENAQHVPVIILTGRHDEETIRRCHNLMAYYVPKCSDVWSRIEPLLGELLGVAPAAPAPACKPAAASPACVHSPALPKPAGDAPPLPAQRPAVVDEAPAAGPSVLCIDDDCQFAFSLKLRLEGHGVDVLRAASGMEGYRSAFMSRPKAIVLDYEMPDGRGDYVLRRLKENPCTRKVPVIVLTGVRDKALERRMVNIGATCFLNKPINWSQLWNELQRHLAPAGTAATAPDVQAPDMEAPALRAPAAEAGAVEAPAGCG